MQPTEARKPSSDQPDGGTGHRPGPPTGADAPPRAAIIVLSLATTLAIVDATVVNLALPRITEDLGLSFAGAEWVVSGYAVATAALLVSLGRLGDRLGRRAVLAGGVVGFVAASLLCAAAQNAGTLIAGRVLQGTAAAAILPGVISVINASYRGPARTVAFAIQGATIATMAALGPVVGAWLVQALDWQWAFLVNLPVGVLVLAGLYRYVPESRDGGRAAGADPAGQVLLVAGLALLVLGLIDGPRYGWLRPDRAFDLGPLHWSAGAQVSAPGLALLVAVLLLTGFVLVERARGRRGRACLMDLALFRVPSFRVGSLSVLVVALGEFGLVFLLPLYLQVQRGLEPLDAQVALLPVAAGSFLSAGLAQALRAVAPRTLVQLGLGLEVVALAGVAVLLRPDTSLWVLGALLLAYGAGVGFAIAQLTGLTLADVPLPQLGQASGISSTARQVGSAIGVAVLGAISTGVLGAVLSDRLADAAPQLGPAQRDALVRTVTDSPAAALGAGGRGGAAPTGGGDAAVADVPAVRSAASDGLTAGVRAGAAFAAACIALSLLNTRRLPARPQR